MMRPFLFASDVVLEEGARLAGYAGRELEYGRIIEQAMWDEDRNTLSELAHCKCCCADHTFECCPARLWYGCRGQSAMTWAERESWIEHYERFHGMTREEFFA